MGRSTLTRYRGAIYKAATAERLRYRGIRRRAGEYIQGAKTPARQDVKT